LAFFYGLRKLLPGLNSITERNELFEKLPLCDVAAAYWGCHAPALVGHAMHTGPTISFVEVVVSHVCYQLPADLRPRRGGGVSDLI